MPAETEMSELLANTVRAWDRSEQGRGVRESVLWDLDRRLGIEEPFTSLTEIELISARNRRDPNPNSWAHLPWSYWGGSGYYGGGGGGCAAGAGGGEAGSGCGGGGCGGGGCGGGGS